MITSPVLKKPLDRTRFLKVLALAESDQDGEALVAVRKAAAMARDAGLSLGEAIGRGQAGDPTLSDLELDLAVQVGKLQAEVDAARKRVRELESRSIGGELQRYNEGYAAGKQAGYTAAFAPMECELGRYRRQIEALEIELEGHRPALDWAALAKEFSAAGARWGSAKAKAIKERAKKGTLTMADKVELRAFSEKLITRPRTEAHSNSQARTSA